MTPSAGPASRHLILCHQCGTAIEPNSANLCIACLRNAVDITEGIPKQAALQFCRGCERYLHPPNLWQRAELESKELLAMCLKRLKGMNKVRLIDAGFIWTEPHSRRVRVKLTIQREVFSNTVLQQIFEVEYVVQYQQCPDCTRLAAKNTWQSMVQVRQKVKHKRTFLYLEQVILKYNAHRDTVNIREAKDGLDFYYAARSHAVKMVEFLTTVVPARTKTSERLISVDIHSNSSSYKHTFSVELVPICKDDLIVLPPKLAASLGNIHPITICNRVTSSIHLLDPNTLQMTDLSAPLYWRNAFDPLMSTPEMVEFIVLDIEPTGVTRGKLILADVEVARSSALGSSTTSDLVGNSSKPLTRKERRKGRHKLRESEDKVSESMDSVAASAPVDFNDLSSVTNPNLTYHTRTHLGAILKAGDTVLGYFLGNTNFNHELYDLVEEHERPDIVLIRKTHPRAKTKGGKKRNWKLKSIAAEAEDPEQVPAEDERNVKATGAGGQGRGALGRRGGHDTARVEADYEMFLRDLEEDPELRAGINLYRANGRTDANTAGERRALQAARRAKQGQAGMEVDPDVEEAQHLGEESHSGEEDLDDYTDGIDVSELLDDMEEMHIDQGEEYEEDGKEEEGAN